MRLLLILSALLLNACTTINVDHIKLEDNLTLAKGDSVVVLGRRQSSESETEPSLVSCVGNKLQRNTQDVQVISEEEFVDQFYPWFEARTAPLHPKRLQSMLDKPFIAENLQQLNVRYFVWVRGATERTNSAGSMSCVVGPGGGGCFGFGTWEDTSDYELTLWDMQSLKEVGRISTDAVGTSYMPAFVIPLPLLAGVKNDACQGMATQLVKFFGKQGGSLKTAN